MDVINKEDAIHSLGEQPYQWSDDDDYCLGLSNQWSYDVHAIEALSPITIVYCKDCKHNYVDGTNVRFNVCELNHNKVQRDDWFCADGEEKDE